MPAANREIIVADKVPVKDAVAKAMKRVEEIFTLVAEDLKKSSYADMVVSGGAILTGGGSQLRGSKASSGIALIILRSLSRRTS